MTPPIKAPSFGRSANCPFPQDCLKWQEDCAFFTTEDWMKVEAEVKDEGGG